MMMQKFLLLSMRSFRLISLEWWFGWCWPWLLLFACYRRLPLAKLSTNISFQKKRMKKRLKMKCMWWNYYFINILNYNYINFYILILKIGKTTPFTILQLKLKLGLGANVFKKRKRVLESEISWELLFSFFWLWFYLCLELTVLGSPQTPIRHLVSY